MRRWFQFRLSTLLIVVTLCAAVIALLQRAQALHEAARKHEIERSMAEACADLTVASEFRTFRMPAAPKPLTSPAIAEQANQWRLIAVHHERLRDKYRRGAWMPWLMFSSDPPRPIEPAWPKIIR